MSYAKTCRCHGVIMKHWTVLGYFMRKMWLVFNTSHVYAASHHIWALRRLKLLAGFLFNSLFSLQQSSALLALCQGNLPVTDGYPSKAASTAESVSFACFKHVLTSKTWFGLFVIVIFVVISRLSHHRPIYFDKVVQKSQETFYVSIIFIIALYPIKYVHFCTYILFCFVFTTISW